MSAVVLGLAANAAALNWQTYGYVGSDPNAEGAWLTGGMAYLVQVTDTANFAVSDALAVTGGAIVDNATFADGTANGVWNDTSALVAGDTYYFAIITTSAGSSISVPTTGFYAVDLNGDNTTASGFYEVTWNASTGGSFFPNDSYAGASMATAVVPEPTSGLLMLLGMAGLALKRKRA